MIRAFAPGMTMQEPLPQSATNFDVRQEPTAQDDAAVNSGFSAEQGSGGTSDESEVQRLEQLLVARTRERRDLTQELERRSALLRDACARLSELAPRGSELQLREERDAAVARAIEAEVARAEATFKLDEVLGQLLAAGGTRPVLDARPTPIRALSARLAELEEQKQVVDARLVLLEDQLSQEQAQLAIAARERVEAAERFELELSQARASSDASGRDILELVDARQALLGERDGLRARLDESERAFRAAHERYARTHHQLRELQDKLDAERTERFTNTGRAEALVSAREQDQERLRALEAELERSAEVALAETSELRRALDTARVEGAALSTARASDQEQVRALQLELERASEAARAEAASLSAAREQGEARLAALEEELERERSARERASEELRAAQSGFASERAAMNEQLAIAESKAIPLTEDARSRRDAAQQARLEAMRACLLELRLPLVEFENTLTAIANGEGSDETTLPGMEMDADAMNQLEEQIRAKELRIEELEASLRVAQQNELAARTASEERPPKDVSTLKGELIDMRASATRLSDDLAKERSRRRKMAVTVRALQAALESGEAAGPWIEELVSLINEGLSNPPKG